MPHAPSVGSLPVTGLACRSPEFWPAACRATPDRSFVPESFRVVPLRRQHGAALSRSSSGTIDGHGRGVNINGPSWLWVPDLGETHQDVIFEETIFQRTLYDIF